MPSYWIFHLAIDHSISYFMRDPLSMWNKIKKLVPKQNRPAEFEQNPPKNRRSAKRRLTTSGAMMYPRAIRSGGSERIDTIYRVCLKAPIQAILATVSLLTSSRMCWMFPRIDEIANECWWLFRQTVKCPGGRPSFSEIDARNDQAGASASESNASGFRSVPEIKIRR